MEQQTIFNIETVQTKVVKDLVKALNLILTDTNVVFSPNGVKIMTTDPSQTAVVHLKLNNFENYECQRTVDRGISISKLHAAVKVANNKDVFRMYNPRADENKLVLEFDNDEKKQKTIRTLSLLDMPNNELNIPDIEFNTILEMPSADLHKYCQDMKGISDKIEIKNIGQQLILFCEDQDSGSSQTVILGDAKDNESNISSSNISFEKNTDNIIQGYYNLKLLELFTKCNDLCKTVKICMKNDFPIFLIYKVGDLGELKLGLSPLNTA